MTHTLTNHSLSIDTQSSKMTPIYRDNSASDRVISLCEDLDTVADMDYPTAKRIQLEHCMLEMEHTFRNK